MRGTVAKQLRRAAALNFPVGTPIVNYSDKSFGKTITRYEPEFNAKGKRTAVKKIPVAVRRDIRQLHECVRALYLQLKAQYKRK